MMSSEIQDGTKADIDTQPIVNSQATITQNPILCLQFNKFIQYFKSNNIERTGAE